MSIPKAAGIETEYGIIILGDPHFSPFLVSQQVLNTYQQTGSPAIPTGMYYNTQTGSAQETAEQAAQDVHGDSSLAASSNDEDKDDPEYVDAAEPANESANASSTATTTGANGSGETAGTGTTTQVLHYGLGSLMLANGARFYIDHAHPEYCTPETLSPRRVVAADKAGERIVARCMSAANRNGSLPDGQQILIYKNNSDQKGNSYGCHENYLLSVDLFEDLLRRRSHLIYRYLLPFQVSRVVICGAGKVGYENKTEAATFQLSQRADFFEMLTGHQTTYRRPLFNLRDEPHAETNTYRRLHVILGDANMSEISTYLKVGTTQLVLHMIEDGFIKADLTLADPVAAFQQVSRDLTLQDPLELENGSLMTAAEIQRVYLELAEQYLNEHDGTEEQWHLWDLWADVIDALQENDEDFLSTRLDWAIKKSVLDRYLDTQNVTWETVAAWQPLIETIVAAEVSHPEPDALGQALARHVGLSWADYAQQREVFFTLRRLDLEYHDIRQDAGLFYRLQGRGLVERLLTDDEIAAMLSQPPPDTRAWLRGKMIEKFAPHVTGADWSYLRLRDPDANQVYRLEFPNPLVGTERDLGRVWDRLRTPGELFAYFQHGSQEALSG
ncbi:MAG: proteasome accessory factor PafA2 family protein [Anaerolineae bacterium]|nr:proteasome accessory factor PafA2 family protein [Anaerolineae bacterium]